MAGDAAALTDARLGKQPSASMMDAVLAPRLRGATGELKTLGAFLYVDLAHVTMMAETGNVPIAAAKGLLKGLQELERKGADGLSIDPRLGTLLLQIERFLSTFAGPDAGGMLQLARSRVDQGAAIFRVVARDGLLAAMAMHQDLQDSLIARATEWIDVIMPGYTHLQHAQPWVLGHYLLAQVEAFERDAERLRQCYARVNRSALGTVAMAGTSWPIDRRRTAQFLGHPDIIANSKDAGFIIGMDFLPEMAAVLSILMSGLGRLAAELYLWSSFEFGMVDLDESLCGTSSIMPQKKNPHALERVRALSGEALGWMPSQLGLLRSTSTTDCDVNFSSREFIGYFDHVGWGLRLMTDTMLTLRIDRERMAERAGSNWSTASDLADCIVKLSGLDFRRAHHIVATLVRQSEAANMRPADVGSSELDRAAEKAIGRKLKLDDKIVRDALDPVRFVNTRTSEGSVGPAEVAKLLERARRHAVEARAWIDQEKARLASARAVLDKAIEAVLEA